MTLKEKFEEILIAFWTSEWESECEKVADEFAIGFAEWLSERQVTKLQCKSYCKKHTMWFTDKKGYGATTKELLEIYKEKGL